MKIEKINSTHFGRRLKEYEKPEYNQTINEGLEVLNKEIDIIVHSSNTPSQRKQNTGIGSACSTTAENIFYPFLELHGVSKVQAEPYGLRRDSDPTSKPHKHRFVANGSPYEADSFSKNTLMIPLEKLKSAEYGCILSQRTFDNIVQSRHNKSTNKVDYPYVMKQHERALKEAYNTYKEKLKNTGRLNSAQKAGIYKLSADFENIKETKGKLLEKSAIYNILSKVHGENDWTKWTDKVDKTLYTPEKGQKKLAQKRIAEIKKEYKDDIDFFLFKQMLVDRSRRETANKTTLKMIGDVPVALSNVDVWAHQDLFLKDTFLGCPPDAFCEDGQAWDFPVLDPEKIFNRNGSLGEGGKFLYQKYKNLFEENPGGIRIDHIIGLVDPFVYFDKPLSGTSGRLYSSPDNAKLQKYQKTTTEQYASIMKKIVIKAAEDVGLDKNAIICEDLGKVTKPTANVIKMLNLRGVAVTEFTDTKENNIFRGKNVPPHKVIMAGSHDNPSLIMWTNDLFKKPKVLSKHAEMLAEDVLPADASPNARKKFANELMSSKEKFMTAKLAELFTSPAEEIQIFFTDFLGMKQRYNLPGTTGDHNWTLRMPQQFEKTYHRNLENNKGLNLPEVLEIAIKQKGRQFVRQNRELLDNLAKFKNILKEKE